QGEILRSMETLAEEMKRDGADREALKAQLDAQGAELARLTAERQAKEREAQDRAIQEELASLREEIRRPSKAAFIGGGQGAGSGLGTGSPIALDDPDGGFFWTLWAARSTKVPQLNAWGKARLEAMGSYWQDVPAESKATLGDTAAAGGNLVPAAVLGAFR
ncbi:hypothetical protein ACU7M0_37130, partial [Burkholderia cenocepacia]